MSKRKSFFKNELACFGAFLVVMAIVCYGMVFLLKQRTKPVRQVEKIENKR